MLVVPVIADKDPIGVLALYTAEKRDFDDEEIDFLKALADHGGIAIMRAHQAAPATSKYAARPIFRGDVAC